MNKALLLLGSLFLTSCLESPHTQTMEIVSKSNDKFILSKNSYSETWEVFVEDSMKVDGVYVKQFKRLK